MRFAGVMDQGGTIQNGLNLAQRAAMETTSRLITALVSDGLVHVIVKDGRLPDSVSTLTLASPTDRDKSSACIEISLRRGTGYKLMLPKKPGESTVVTPPLEPSDIAGPVVIQATAGSDSPQRFVYRPEQVFDVVAPWIRLDQAIASKLRSELENSADNQEHWFKFESLQAPLRLGSPLIEWEQRVIKGHPTHPMHRSFCANGPPNPDIGDIEEFLKAKVIIISVPRSRIHLDGPFKESIAPLVRRLNIATEAIPPERVLLPCFAAQLPTIHRYFGTDAVREGSSELEGLRQASMRTICFPNFSFHVKMALSFTITSAMRTMTPWTTRMCIEVSRLLEDIVDPELLWIARKRAAACSADPDFEVAKHLSVMLREDPEPRARKLGQCLVLPAALFEAPGEDRVVRAVALFNLGLTLGPRKEWFRNYARLYLRAVLPLLLSHGICLEAHMQNVLARFDVETGALRGFVYRDMGGLRMHVPTMEARGVRIESADLVPGSVVLTDDLEAVWANAYHSFENHMGGALRGLGLQWEGGWDIFREELMGALDASPDPDNKAADLLDFMVQPTVKRKAFLRMKIAGVYRGRVYSRLPNPLST